MHRRSREAKVSVLVDWMRLRIPWAIVVRYGLHINVDNMWSHLMRYKSLATVPHPPPKYTLEAYNVNAASSRDSGPQIK